MQMVPRRSFSSAGSVLSEPGENQPADDDEEDDDDDSSSSALAL